MRPFGVPARRIGQQRAMEIGFAAALLVFGALLWLAALLAGVVRGTVLSVSILSVACGIVLAELDVVNADPSSPELRHLAELALVLTLFSDGLVVEEGLLRRHLSSPVRALVVAMPLTIAAIAGLALLLFPDLTWQEAFLLGAVLAPTDPVVSSVVVTAEIVPPRIRHALNLESGLNDGLAVPFVLFFLILAVPGGDPGKEALRLLGEAIAGGAIGAGLGYAAAKLHPRAPLGGPTGHYMGIFALGIGLAVFGLAELTVGNGLIAAFCAGLTVGIVQVEEVPEEFTSYSEYASSVVEVAAFFAFGALIVSTGFDASVPALIGMALATFVLARPAAVFIAGLGTDLTVRQRAFIAWFGPKGVASMLFALIVLNSVAPDRRLVFDIAAFVILASIILHGLSDTLAARWIAEPAPAEEQDLDTSTA